MTVPSRRTILVVPVRRLPLLRTFVCMRVFDDQVLGAEAMCDEHPVCKLREGSRERKEDRRERPR